MIGFLSRFFARGAPAFTEARPGDAVAIAAIHGASFQRGWGEDEIYNLLIDKNVVAHRAMSGRKLIGFILSRLAAGEVEILSVAITPSWRGQRLARPLLDLHLRQLAGLGARTVFLEVSEHNAPATRLYRRAGFREVGKRLSYYDRGDAALVLRRDLG
ncbi:MAG TPA: GNAT family N-acetyltransferase [Xanthobacteraceae bacterium]|jgi:ribosomal-protein-alanine N-acetyltransferase|nr:GNAT family N-acetyltransferase [Xanthobacteraceae bacterium]